MKSPEGQEMPNPGQYLEIIPNRKLVFTDAFVGNWVPKEGAPFMVAEINFEDAGPGKTKYTAKARHWTVEAKAQHEQMGFIPGWTICAKQLGCGRGRADAGDVERKLGGGRGAQETAAGNLGGRHLGQSGSDAAGKKSSAHVVLPSACWIDRAASLVLPPLATTLIAARMRL